jgi:hypothetical protein
MNLAMRLAGLFGTAVFLLTAMPGFYRQIEPHDFSQMATDTISGMSMLETLLISLGGSVAAGFVGYMIGDILSHPQGKRKKKTPPKNTQSQTQPAEPVALMPEVSGLDIQLDDSALSPASPGQSVTPGELSAEEFH